MIGTNGDQHQTSDGGSMNGAIHLEHVGVPTTAATFDATIRFYTDTFGWRVIEERPSTGPDDRVTFIADGQGGAFEVFVGSGGPIVDPAHLAFAVPFDEFASLAERLTAAGIALDEPFINDVGDQISFFDDPAGNRAQIVGRLKPLPSRDA
jgi:catechol 2,3-dioxygenase-like lactoylglutathione lyase family enzyme